MIGFKQLNYWGNQFCKIAKQFLHVYITQINSVIIIEIWFIILSRKWENEKKIKIT